MEGGMRTTATCNRLRKPSDSIRRLRVRAETTVSELVKENAMVHQNAADDRRCPSVR